MAKFTHEFKGDFETWKLWIIAYYRIKESQMELIGRDDWEHEDVKVLHRQYQIFDLLVGDDVLIMTILLVGKGDTLRLSATIPEDINFMPSRLLKKRERVVDEFKELFFEKLKTLGEVKDE